LADYSGIAHHLGEAWGHRDCFALRICSFASHSRLNSIRRPLAKISSNPRSSGVGRFVYVSFRDNPSVQSPLTRAKRSIERAIADLDFTSVQASYFMEVWLSPMVGFDYIHGTARIYGTGLKPISWVSYRDVAEFCIAPILRSVAERSVVAVGGPEALTPLEVLKIFEEESGRRFEVETIPEANLRAQFDLA
jgi:uncharacterized protein YbjT (DUF2867 family)